MFLYEVKLLPWANFCSMLTESIDLLFKQVLTNLQSMGHAIRTAPSIQEVPLLVTVARVGEGKDLLRPLRNVTILKDTEESTKHNSESAIKRHTDCKTDVRAAFLRKYKSNSDCFVCTFVVYNKLKKHN